MNIEPILKEFKQKIAGLYGQRFKKIVLYSSYARGQADDKNSDIDLAVVLDSDYDSVISLSYYVMFYSDRSVSVVDDVRYCHVERSGAKSRHLAANGRHRPGGGRFLHCGPLLRTSSRNDSTRWAV